VKEATMPNSKSVSVKKKHRIKKNRIKKIRVESMVNAKKSTLRSLSQEGSLPKELQHLI